MEDDITKIKGQVKFVLERYPETRNSDKRLTIQVWAEFYGTYIQVIRDRDFVELEDIMVLPSQASIKRVRANYQNKLGEYLPTRWEIAKKRGWLEDEWKRKLGYRIADNRQMEVF